MVEDAERQFISNSPLDAPPPESAGETAKLQELLKRLREKDDEIQRLKNENLFLLRKGLDSRNLDGYGRSIKQLSPPEEMPQYKNSASAYGSGSWKPYIPSNTTSNNGGSSRFVLPAPNLHKGKKLSFPEDLLTPATPEKAAEEPRKYGAMALAFRDSQSSSTSSTPTFFPSQHSLLTTTASNEVRSLKRSYQPENPLAIRSNSLIIDTNFIKSTIDMSNQTSGESSTNTTTNGESSSKKFRLDLQNHTQMHFPRPVIKEYACNSCSSTNPFGFWVRDVTSPDNFICQVCYAKKSPKYCDLIAESAVPTRCQPCLRSSQTGARPVDNCNECALLLSKAPHYTCNNCSSTTSAGAWYKDRSRQSGAHCQKCYHALNRIRIDNMPDGLLLQRTCLSCTNFKSSSWYKDANHHGGYICKLCYNHRYQSRVNESVAPRSCGTCSSTVSSLWIKDQSKPGEYLCKRCYHQMDKYKLVVKADGTIGTRDCCLCESHDSSRWYRDSANPSLYNCVRCYNRRKKEDKQSLTSVLLKRDNRDQPTDDDQDENEAPPVSV